jgi:hypothetical protein
MNDNTGGLIQHQQDFILVKNAQREILGLRLSGARFRNFKLYDFADTGLVCGLGRLSVNANIAAFD